MDIAALITDLQSRGLRVESAVERRSGGAGPSDSGLLWIEGVAVTVPTGTAWADASPYVLREEDEGYGIYLDGARLAAASAGSDPVTTTSRPPTASRTGRSPCCTSIRWPRRCSRAIFRGRTPSAVSRS